ncbi:MAG: biotin/lipoyl-containing protein [Candidatus Limnocylindrales bacterium]|nr:biotin/lipoyl-containing protein [Candidatus Limnocylindrales bacterium]
MSSERPSTRVVDPRAVRVATAPATTAIEAAPIVLEPAAVPLAPASGERGGQVLIDGVPAGLRLDRRDAVHVVLVEGQGRETSWSPVIMLPLVPTAGPAIGVVRREVIVDGWRIEVEIESERRAALRERARRGGDETARAGPTEVRAIIPGQVLAVSIAPGDSVLAGQQLLVVEAMKMQNELRAPRDGVVSRVAVGPGRTIEVGDLLLVLE